MLLCFLGCDPAVDHIYHRLAAAAQQAGQQTYNTYMQGLTDKIPELYSLALQAYNNQGNDLKDRYSLLGTADNQDYRRYRDSVSD